MDDVQKIRCLLDERGVDYDELSRNFSHKFLFDYCEACADYLSEIEIFGGCICATKNYLTPEQAISVTLGGERGEPVLECKLTDDELEILDAMPALKHLAMKAGLI